MAHEEQSLIHWKIMHVWRSTKADFLFHHRICLKIPVKILVWRLKLVLFLTKIWTLKLCKTFKWGMQIFLICIRNLWNISHIHWYHFYILVRYVSLIYAGFIYRLLIKGFWFSFSIIVIQLLNWKFSIVHRFNSG